MRAINSRRRVFSDLRGEGVWIGCELDDPWRGKSMDVLKAAGDAGLIVLVAGPDVVRLAPSLVISLDEILPTFHEAGERALPIVDWSPAVEDPERQTELRDVLNAALDALPEEYRAVIVLRDVEGFSNDEVAEALHLTVANVKTRVHRGRLFLRKRLADYASAA